MKMTVGQKIGATSAVLVVFTLMLAGASLISIGTLSDKIHLLQVDSIPGQYSSGRIDALARGVRVGMNAELLEMLSGTGKDSTSVQAATSDAQEKLRAQLAAYEKTITTTEDRQNFNVLAPALDKWYQSWNRVRALGQAGKNADAMALYRSETVAAFAPVETAVGVLVEENQAAAKQHADDGANAADTAKWWSRIIALVSVIVGALLALFVVATINRGLRHAVQELSEGAEQVAAAAGQVSSSSQSLAQGSSEQAASLEETSASSEQINSMARKNSENSRSAASLVTHSQDKFAETNLSLDQMVVAMGEINTQSDKISRIIKVIDEIAFQTNILALNAAVEAARAGEAGMGFAVVADEVRSLAQRCAQAAKDTAAMIEESIAKSKDGKSTVDAVAAAIRAITAEAANVKLLVDEVSLGSNEQARGIEQIGKAIIQMEQVTQKTAANAEESASAAEELNAQSETLKDIVARLTEMVGGGSHPQNQSSRRVSATSGRNKAGRGETVSGLASLRKAVSGSVAPAESRLPAHAGHGMNRDEFPLEDNFREF